MSRDREERGQRSPGRFPDRYGAWAFVAGASEGLGAAFARALAERGLNLLIAARRAAPLEDLAAEIRARSAVQVRSMAGDLAESHFLQSLQACAADLDLGVIVSNAAYVPIGEFASRPAADVLRAVDVNVRAPVTLLRSMLPLMIERERGAVILMSSLAGYQGIPRIAMYTATKAFTRVLAEGLWRELRGSGVDIVACCAGAVRTPGYSSASAQEAPGTMDSARVVEITLRSLGHGPVVIPGLINRAAALLTTRILSRRAAIGIMARSTSMLGQPNGKKMASGSTS